MSRHDSAPTYSWVFTSQVNKWLAVVFVFCLLIVGIAVWTITYTLRRDCTDVYKQDVNTFGYWLHIEAGSMAESCPRYEAR